MANTAQVVRPMEVAFGGGMAFLAGATDVYGLARLQGLYVSFMSGNTTMLGIALGGEDWKKAALIGSLVALFVAGAAGGAVLSSLTGRMHPVAISFAVTLVLAVPLAAPSAEIVAFTAAMGALNAAMNSVNGVAVSLTYVTGTLVKIGQGIGRALCGRTEDLGWTWQIPMWLSLLAGAVAATLVRSRYGDAEWPLPTLAGLLTMTAALQAACFSILRETFHM